MIDRGKRASATLQTAGEILLRIGYCSVLQWNDTIVVIYSDCYYVLASFM